MGMYDKYAFAGDFKYEMDKIYETIQEVWNNGYDDGQSFGVSEVLDALRKIIKWEGGISEEVIDIILNAEYNEVQEYADALEKKIRIGDVVKIDEDTLAIVTDPTNELLTVMTCEGQFWNVDPHHIDRTNRHIELGVALDSLANMQSKLRTKGEQI